MVTPSKEIKIEFFKSLNFQETLVYAVDSFKLSK